NPYLDEKEIEHMLSSMSEEEQASRRFGKFSHASGLVYPEFDPAVHVIEPFDVPFDWQAEISIDPGLNNPTSCHFYAVDYDGNVYVVAEHYERGKDVEYHASRLHEIANSLGWRRDGGGRLRALIDSAANQRTLASVKSVAELFSDYGISVNTKVNKDLYTGIQRIKTYLSQRPPRLYIFKNCVNLIRELKSYWWGDDDRPQKRDDHALDELRYFIMSRPAPPKMKKEGKSLIEADKEKLIRQSKRRNGCHE
ncbi:MAG: hypothetical protein GX891_01665, partial [Clostridiales bacterium]|nr:hypothetical protein [Clostridiales bacterium]